MKKEIVAIVLLLLILAGNIWNRQQLNKLINDLSVLTEEAYSSAQSADWRASEAAARNAEETWTGARAYTHIFIRHTDVDALTSSLCAYRGAISGRDDGDILASYLCLKAGLSCLRDMEALRVGSVF